MSVHFHLTLLRLLFRASPMSRTPRSYFLISFWSKILIRFTTLTPSFRAWGNISSLATFFTAPPLPDLPATRLAGFQLFGGHGLYSRASKSDGLNFPVTYAFSIIGVRCWETVFTSGITICAMNSSSKVAIPDSTDSSLALIANARHLHF